jgi:hypothetical protein
MIRTLYTLSLILLTHTAFGQFIDDTHTQPGLRGRIDSVVVKTWSAEENNQERTLVSKDVCIYNKNQHIITSYYYLYLAMPHTGVVKDPVKTAYTYDGEGNLIESMRYFSTGEPWVQTTYLKSADLVVSREYYCPNKILTNTDSLIIDKDERVIERDSYVKGLGLYSKSYFKYDKNRLIKEDTYSSNGVLMFERQCRYDIDHNIIEDDNINGDREKHIYTYDKFDKKHNWLVRTEYLNARPYWVEERLIYYHK